MNTTIQSTLMDLMQRVIEDPDHIPIIPFDVWPEDTEQQHLLTSFRDMLERLQRHYQDKLEATDITSSKLAEEQLHEREEQYRSIFEATYDGLIISTLDGFVVEVNPAFGNMYDYTREELIGLHVSTLAAPVDQHILDEVLEKRKAGKSYQTVVAQALRKDGTAFYVESHGTTFTYRGKSHTLGVVRDITERVEAEQQLREQEEQYRSIFETTTDGLVIFDLDGFIVEANPAACDVYGCTYEELIGLHISVLTHPDTFAMMAEAFQRIQAGSQVQNRAITLHKDGTPFYAEGHATPFTYKGKLHMLVVVRDITEQIEAEQQLRDREEQYRNIFEATYDGVIITDIDGFFVEANPAFCSMYGYTRDELIGLHSSVLTAPASLPTLADALKTFQTGEAFQTVGQSMRKDGTVFYVEGRGITFTFKGKPHALSAIRDITERVEAEQQLREREEQYRAVFEATTDGLVILDQDGFFVEANPAMCCMYGYTHEEFIGLHTSAVTIPGSLRVLTTSLERTEVGKGFQGEGQGVRKDGSVFYAEAHLTPITYQGKPHLLVATHDITERVQAQQLLEQRVEERTRELASLLEISHTVASTLQLKPLLRLILDQIQSVVDYTGASILTLEGDRLVFLDHRGPVPEEQLVPLRFPLKDLGLIWETLLAHEPILIENVHEETPLAQAFRTAMDELLQSTFGYICAWMAVPLQLRDQVIGMLALASQDEGAFTSHHATLALAIANQAAIAIENARLYEQAQELAAVEERQRLARELHDSVSQALYGISLGVHTARLQLDHDPGELAESLDYVLELAEAALTEMRALIFELRPESLEAEGLITALTKQAAAMQARHNIIVQLDLCDEPDVSLKVKRELYRVAQEALHNMVKHAEANKVDLHLHMTDGVIILEVSDNGKGFEATGSFPGHLGLHSMRERIESLDGGLQIESAPGQGTSIRAHIPVRETTTLNGG